MGLARVQISVNIQSGNLAYQSLVSGGSNTAFNAAVAGSNGPTPGAMLIATDPGTDGNFAELTTFGGFCVITNLDSNNYVTYGIHDAVAGKFYPLGEILPGEQYVIRMSRKLGLDYPGTGTGAGSTTLRLVANTAPVRVKIEAFDP